MTGVDPFLFITLCGLVSAGAILAWIFRMMRPLFHLGTIAFAFIPLAFIIYASVKLCQSNECGALIGAFSVVVALPLAVIGSGYVVGGLLVWIRAIALRRGIQPSVVKAAAAIVLLAIFIGTAMLFQWNNRAWTAKWSGAPITEALAESSRTD